MTKLFAALLFALLAGAAFASAQDTPTLQQEIALLRERALQVENPTLRAEVLHLLDGAQLALNRNQLDLARAEAEKAAAFFRDRPVQPHPSPSPTEGYPLLLLIASGLALLLYANQKPSRSLPLVGIALLTTAGAAAFLVLASLSSAKALAVGTGYVTLAFLGVTLLIGPVARVTKKPRALRLVSHRRNIGVMAFLLGVVHAVLGYGYHAGVNRLFFERLFHAFFREGPGGYVLKIFSASSTGFSGDWFALSIWIGVLALIILAILAATSNLFSIRRLGGTRWKTVHRFAYLALALSFAHTLIMRLFYWGILPSTIKPLFRPVDYVLFLFALALLTTIIVFQIKGYIITKSMLNARREAGQTPSPTKKQSTLPTVVAVAALVILIFATFLAWLLVVYG